MGRLKELLIDVDPEPCFDSEEYAAWFAENGLNVSRG